MKIMLLGSALLAALLAAAGLGCSREAPEKEEISKEPSCRIDTDCPEKQACEQGVCRSQAPECRDDGECPRGFACTDWQCRPWQGPCTSDQGCPADSQCSEGSCRPFVCSADLDCGEGGWICGGGICKAGCQSDEECTGTQRCLSSTHRCGFECTIDSDCEPGEVCYLEEQVCVAEGWCQDDSHCPRGQVCEGDACSAVPCVRDEECAPARRCDVERGACVPLGCQADEDCAAGEHCHPLELECLSPGHCYEDDDCAAGQWCEVIDGLCVAEEQRCSGPDQCAAGSVCNLRHQRCVPGECLEDADCPDGKGCQQERRLCLERCGEGGACPPATSCDGRSSLCDWPRCEQDSDCGEREVCRAVTMRCEQVECREAGHCGERQRCRPGDWVCFEVECDLDEHCGERQRCNPGQGACYDVECNRDEHCGERQRCALPEGSCYDVECNRNEHCGERQRCSLAEGVCHEVPCNADEHCQEQQHCDLPTGRCYDLACSRDEDCLPAGSCVAAVGRCLPEGGCVDDAREEDDLGEQADIAAPGTIEGQLCPGDEDWFRVEVAGGLILTADLLFRHADGDLNLFLYAGDATTLLVASATEDDSEQVKRQVLEDEVCYLRVDGMGGAGSAYQLRIAIAEESPPLSCPADDRYEENDGPGSATPIMIGGEPVSGIICPWDEDWYSMELRAEEEVVVDLLFTHRRHADLDLYVYDRDGAREIDNSRSISDNEQVSIQAGEAGTYFIRVDGFVASENSYQLRVAEAPGEP